MVLGYGSGTLGFPADGSIDHRPFFKGARYIQGALPNYRKGGVDAVILAYAANHRNYPGTEGVARICQILGSFLKELRNYSDTAELATSASGVRRARKAGKLAIILHLTGLPLAGMIEHLHGYYAMGVRSVHCPFGESLMDERDWDRGENPGLSPLERDAIKEMASLGMLIDLAHASDRMIRDVLAMNTGPVIVSHGACRALCDTKRNITDAQIRKIARTGGVIGVHFGPGIIDTDSRKALRATGFYEELGRWEKRLRRKYPDLGRYLSKRFNQAEWVKTKAFRLQQSVPGPPITRVIDHIDRITDLAGIDHVGIGPDYDMGTTPEGLERADRMPNLTQALLERGYSGRAVRKILGGNFMRVFRDVLKE